MTDKQREPTRWLLVDDDVTFCEVLARALRRRGLTVEVAHSTDQAMELISHYQPQRAVLDLKMEGPSGLTLLEQLKQEMPELEVVILTGYSSIATAVEAIKLGAVQYLCKPTGVDEILSAFDAEQESAEITIPSSPPSVDRLEWEHIQKVLQENDGNISATARALNMHRRTLQRKLQKRPVKQ